MTTLRIQSSLPLLVTGLSRTFLGWLRTAGIPFTGYASGSSLIDFLSKNPGRFLIYDSRNLTSRHEAETALGHDCEIIDMAPSAQTGFESLSPHDRERSDSISAASWILSLKRKIQEHHGIWMRIHDLPHGYESVVFRDGLPRQPELRLVAEALSPVLKHETRVPPPHFAVDHVFHADGSTELEQNFGCWWNPHRPTAGKFAANVWSVETEQFARWWRLRDQLRIQVHVTSNELRIVNHSHQLTDRWSPIVELWRSGHVARIPLTHPTLVLNQSGMVYCRESFRHPAGLFLSQGIAAPASTSPKARPVSQPI